MTIFVLLWMLTRGSPTSQGQNMVWLSVAGEGMETYQAGTQLFEGKLVIAFLVVLSLSKSVLGYF